MSSFISFLSKVTGGNRAWSLNDLAVWPSLVYIYVLAVLQLGRLDEAVVAAFYDPERHLFPLKHNFWARDVMHNGAHDIMVGIGMVTLMLAVLAGVFDRWRHLRRPLTYLVTAMVISIVTISISKEITNMDCPWDLVEFGGQRVHYTLLQEKPDSAPRGHCFPGGHSSSGFALFALFFVGRAHQWRRPAFALVPALTIGGVFALDQWARGAHFPSHDLTTAYLCWMISLAVYRLFYREAANIG